MILDLGMPDMDGYAVARAVRGDPSLARTRLIALSGYGQREDRRRTAEAGFDEHLVKPVEHDVLNTALG
jgi:CheY-like chemotaxis protein